MKALCLGAKAVLIGRPVVYGLAINGKMGAKSVIEGLLAELWQSMGLAGMRTVDECSQNPLIWGAWIYVTVISSRTEDCSNCCLRTVSRSLLEG